MKYKNPTLNGKPYFVPVVVKNKSYLVGFLHAKYLFLSLMDELADDIEVDTNVFETCLDSSRFTDVMLDGRKISECTEKEYNDHLESLLDSRFSKNEEEHPDNGNKVKNEAILKIECPCGLGFYEFDTIKDIPEKNFKCNQCGRIILEYTNEYDIAFDYDGGDPINEDSKED